MAIPPPWVTVLQPGRCISTGTHLPIRTGTDRLELAMEEGRKGGTMAGPRVNVTTAAKLTGRSEKTIRTWLAEEPCPLSVEWGQYRGGRRLAGTERKPGPVKKGRTRQLDVD